jgi:serine/threonine-protein kinase HipA
MEALNIYFNTQKIGILYFNSHTQEFGLEYTKQWKKEGFPISPILGLDENFKSHDIKNYIENLLPEGDGLDKLVLLFQISKSNKYALLEAIGKDTSGALSFVKDEISKESIFREITHEELSQRIKQRNEISIVVWDEKPRLSVAGVQEKLPVCKINEKYGLGDGTLSSTHILKFDKGNDNLVLNEYTSLHLAKIAKLTIPNIEILNFDGELVLEVERFDRIIIDDKHVKKLQVIDSCQALGFPPSFKYERNFGNQRDVKEVREGVSFTKLDKLTKIYAKIPIIMKVKMIDWTIINLILGNSDAHGKNISFFVDKGGLEVAPFYDIVNVTMYKGKYAQDMAMAIDDEFEFEKIGLFDILEFLQLNKISKTQYFNDFKKLAQKIHKNLDFSFIDSSLREEEKEFIQEYRNNVIQRLNSLSDVVNRMRFDLPFESESYDDFFDSYEDTILKRVGKSDYSKQEAVEKYLLSIENELIPS